MLYQNIMDICKPYVTKDEKKPDQQVFQLFTALSKDMQRDPQSGTRTKREKSAGQENASASNTSKRSQTSSHTKTSSKEKASKRSDK